MEIISKSLKVPEPYTGEGAEGVAMVNMIGEAEGAPNFVMRLFNVAVGGHTPFHNHDFEHVVYVIKGQGTLKTPGGDHSFEEGDGVYVAPDEEHQFVNAGNCELVFTCTIPNRLVSPPQEEAQVKVMEGQCT